jgi:hypothetical protein
MRGDASWLLCTSQLHSAYCGNKDRAVASAVRWGEISSSIHDKARIRNHVRAKMREQRSVRRTQLWLLCQTVIHVIDC